MANVSAKIYEHHKKVDGTYNVKICVYHKGKRKYIDTMDKPLQNGPPRPSETVPFYQRKVIPFGQSKVSPFDQGKVIP